MKENNLSEKFFFIQTKDLFELNDICLIKKKSLGQINICLNQINVFSKQRNLCIDVYSKIWFVWFKAKINLIWTNFHLVQRYIVWIK